MHKTNRILSSLLFLLLVIFSNRDADSSALSSYNHFVFTGHSATANTYGRTIRRPSLYQQKIKVRYMGGDGRYNATPAFASRPPLFSNEIKTGTYTSSFHSYFSFSFNLRGPPTV